MVRRPAVAVSRRSLVTEIPGYRETGRPGDRDSLFSAPALCPRQASFSVYYALGAEPSVDIGREMSPASAFLNQHSYLVIALVVLAVLALVTSLLRPRLRFVLVG